MYKDFKFELYSAVLIAVWGVVVKEFPFSLCSMSEWVGPIVRKVREGECQNLATSVKL